MKRFLLYITLMLTALTGAFAQGGVRVGAENFNAYLPLLRGKKVAVVSNQTGVIPVRHHVAAGNDSLACVHIVDVLLNSGIVIAKIFSPEHGFRGQAEAGATVNSGKDAKTGLPVVSLYGKHKKPTAGDLQGMDLVLFDLQDVGARFYTYISTLHYVMEACAENRLPVVVLDRPNPHAGYTDGPVLDTSSCRSFVGMHPVPVVYGMTIGEYARMINGERWLSGGAECDLQVVPLEGYTRNTACAFPVPPSPNLRSMKAVYAYPSLCFFEGTPLSVGRGTYRAFECAGFPGSAVGDFRFTPRPLPGLSANPPFKDEECTGFFVPDSITRQLPRKLDLSYLLNLYRAYPQKDRFFNAFFVKLAGVSDLERQIREGWSEEEIRASWKPALERFEKVRQKYLLYP